MVTNCKTLKEWEDFGLLAELPEDRKQMTVDCYNIATKWLMDCSIVTSEKAGEFEPLVLPIFYRITKVIDLTEAQVLETCKEFLHSWSLFDLIEHVSLGDPELHFVESFAEMKINQYKIT